MKTDELRRACEAVGLEVYDHPSIPAGVWIDGWGRMYMSHPVLLPYVASLLVAKVRERGLDAKYHVQLCDFRISGIDHVEYWASATDEQRIRAAMEVINDTR